jgi:hypothetical protein
MISLAAVVVSADVVVQLLPSPLPSLRLPLSFVLVVVIVLVVTIILVVVVLVFCRGLRRCCLRCRRASVVVWSVEVGVGVARGCRTRRV